MKIQVTLYGTEALRAIRLLQADDERLAAEKANAITTRADDRAARILAALPQKNKAGIYAAVRGSKRRFYETLRALLASGAIVQGVDGVLRRGAP